MSKLGIANRIFTKANNEAIVSKKKLKYLKKNNTDKLAITHVNKTILLYFFAFNGYLLFINWIKIPQM